MENKVDWLREAARGFAKLKNIRYDLLIAHAGKTLNLSIGFDNSHFHHIAGLHKLKDVDQLRLRRKRSTAMIFEEIMRGKISLATIENSAFLTSKIIERIKLAGMLESIMDADNLLFSFDARYGQARFSPHPPMETGRWFSVVRMAASMPSMPLRDLLVGCRKRPSPCWVRR